MSKNIKRIISVLLTLVMLVSLSTQGLASMLPSADATYNARIRIANGARDTASELADSKTPLTTATGGKVTESAAEGVKIQSNTYGDSGVFVTGAAANQYVFGGSKDYYTVNGVGYNSVIHLDLSDSDCKTATDSYSRELAGGFGIGVTGSKLIVENAYISTSGPGRPATYTSNLGTLIVKDSYVSSTGGTSSFIPGFKLLNGSARTNLTMGGTTYFYNSTVMADAWGAMSTDTGGENNTYLYAYNSYAEATSGGYGAYSDTNCFVYLYGSKLASGEFGAIIASNGELHADSGANASAEVKANLDSDDATTAEGSSIIGARNAVMIHVVDSFQATGADSAGLKYAGVLDVKNSTLSTVTDLTSAGDYVNDKKVGASAPYINHHLGSVILFRGGNANVTLDNVTMTSSNNTLIHSVVDYDPGGAVYAEDGQEFLGINVSLKNMNVTGDVLHEDYQRKMELSLTDTTLNGKIVSGTMAGWNALWSSYSSEIQAELIQNTSYESQWGLSMTMDAASSWIVTETSSLASLTIQEGASITVPDGYTMSIYTGCDMDNDNVFYDDSTATKITAFEPGVTYKGVVIVVSQAGTAAFSDVSKSDWFCDSVYAAAKAGLVAGKSDSTYAPSEELTWTQTITLAVRVYEYKNGGVVTTNDATGYQAYFDAALKYGIIDKEPATPDAAISRGDAAVIFAAALGDDQVVNDVPEGFFNDVAAGAQYHDAVYALAKAGICNGKGNNVFGVGDTFKRSEAAAIVARMCGLEDPAELKAAADTVTDDISQLRVSSYSTLSPDTSRQTKDAGHIFVGYDVVDGALNAAESNWTTDHVSSIVFSNAVTGAGFTALKAEGKSSVINITGNLKLTDESDGAYASDFTGTGVAVVATDYAKVTATNLSLYTEGFVRASFIAYNSAEVYIKDSSIVTVGANPLTEAYEGYTNSANTSQMISPPWVLGIQGGIRTVNVLGDNATLLVVNSDLASGGWGVLSTDGCTNPAFYVVDSNLKILAEREGGMDSGWAILGYDEDTYGSGYGAYVIGNATENYYGTVVNGATYGVVAREGTAIFQSSKDAVTLYNAYGDVVDTVEGQGNVSTINTVYGFMTHASQNAYIHVMDGTVVNTEEATFLYKSSTVAEFYVDKAVLNPSNGIILQMMDDDDSTVGGFSPFNDYLEEDAGLPSISGNVTGSAGNAHVVMEMTNGAYAGDLYNGTGYYTQGGDVLSLTIGEGATLTGDVALTQTVHGIAYSPEAVAAIEKASAANKADGYDAIGYVFLDAAFNVTQNESKAAYIQFTKFSINQYYLLDHVLNSNFCNGTSGANVYVKDGGVWTVEKESLISYLSVEKGSTVYGAITVNADGSLTLTPSGTALSAGEYGSESVVDTSASSDSGAPGPGGMPPA